MTRRIPARLAFGLLVAMVLAGCGDGQPTAPGTAPTTAPTSAPATGTASGADTFSATLGPAWGQEVTPAGAKRCPVTRPDTAPTPPGSRLFGWRNSHGNGKLWVGGLWEDGVVAADHRFIQEDGSVDMKFGWWRSISGDLTITGRRLDEQAPPLEAHIPSGYGDTGFQATGVTFPTEGCWEVTGKVGTTTLTFVTFVIKREARSP